MSDPDRVAIRIAGLILAGGASRRMGTPKALLEIGAETFIDRLVGLFNPVVSPLIVVLGHDSELVRHGMDSRSPVTFAVNRQPERGMLSSLQCGLRELPSETGAVIFSPVDYPSCQGTTVARIADEFRNRFRTHACDVVIPIYRGVKGHPVCISRRVVDELLELPFTGQAREIIRGRIGTTVFIEVDDPGITTDVDTPEDYRSLMATAVALS